MEPSRTYLKFPGSTLPSAHHVPDPSPVRRHAGNLPVKEIAWTLPGFSGNARVTTSFGNLPIQALRLRDPLRTKSGTFASVDWVKKMHLDEEFLRTHPDAQPISIRAGALGQGIPAVDLVVSPHQKVNVSRLQFSQDFRYARDLTDTPGIMRKPELLVTYYQFHCTLPVTVCVEGTWVSVCP